MLETRVHRFSELRRAIDGVSERMLAQTLQWLEGDGLVDRIAYEVVPPHVEYRLTPLGREAAEKVSTLADWIEGSLPRILQAHDQRSRNARRRKRPHAGAHLRHRGGCRDAVDRVVARRLPCCFVDAVGRMRVGLSGWVAIRYTRHNRWTAIAAPAPGLPDSRLG
ncbi:winged helix-turn-helix transcriptional regulator [Lysobacter sp. A286]